MIPMRVRRPGSAAWTPASATNLKYQFNYNDSSKVWADAAATTHATNGGALQRINDSSGKGFCNALIDSVHVGVWSSSDANMNGKGSLQVASTGGPQGLVGGFTASATLAQAYTRVIVVYESGSSATYRALCDGATTAESLIRADTGTGKVFAYCGGPGVLASSATAIGLFCYVLIPNGSSGILRQNGTTICSGNFGSSVLSGVSHGYQYGSPPTFGMIGAIGEEFCIAEDVIATGLITSIDAYIFAKFGVHA